VGLDRRTRHGLGRKRIGSKALFVPQIGLKVVPDKILKEMKRCMLLPAEK